MHSAISITPRGALNYESIFENAPIAICVVTQNTIRNCNPAAAVLFGYAPQLLIGNTLNLLFSEQIPNVDGYGNFARGSARSNAGDYQAVLRRADRELFWCQVRSMSLQRVPFDTCIYTFEEITDPRDLGQILSPREEQIAVALLSGKSNKDIAHELTLSLRTIEFYRGRLMRKLQVTNVKELICRLLGFVAA